MTGYIGGDAFYVLEKAHPDWEYTALVRSSDKGALLAKKYPKIRLVYGDLNSSQLLEDESMRADVVLSESPMRTSAWHVSHLTQNPADFADADGEAGAKSIAKGLAGHTPAKPGYLIHTSGTGILLFHDMDRGVFGDEHPKIYDDVANIDELNTLPDHALHRSVDKVVQAAASDAVRTAIVCPPTIYDIGRGEGNTRSVQIPNLASAMIQRGQAFHIGQGKTFWGNVNVHDLSEAYRLLTEAAVAGGGKASWGRNGYYFVENGEVSCCMQLPRIASRFY